MWTISSITRTALLAPRATFRSAFIVRLCGSHPCFAYVNRGSKWNPGVREALQRALHASLCRLLAADHRSHPHGHGHRAPPDMLQGKQHFHSVHICFAMRHSLCLLPCAVLDVLATDQDRVILQQQWPARVHQVRPETAVKIEPEIKCNR